MLCFSLRTFVCERGLYFNVSVSTIIFWFKESAKALYSYIFPGFLHFIYNIMEDICWCFFNTEDFKCLKTVLASSWINKWDTTRIINSVCQLTFTLILAENSKLCKFLVRDLFGWALSSASKCSRILSCDFKIIIIITSCKAG